jgi:hypothetical protein
MKIVDKHDNLNNKQTLFDMNHQEAGVLYSLKLQYSPSLFLIHFNFMFMCWIIFLYWDHC